jgi:Collagen triple helix repeat (20 copies)
MFQSIAKRMRVTPSGAIATLALVFAMTGGAYAASHYLITKTSQIKPSVLAQLKGKGGPAGASGAPGAAGALGPAGPAGAAGPQGPAGPGGPAGSAGKDGAPGKDGKEGEPGLPGAKGAEGSPWTAGGTLPSGKTETGTWAAAGVPVKEENGEKAEVVLAPISFPIPLKEGLEGSLVLPENDHVHVIRPSGEGEGKFEAGKNEGFNTGCPKGSKVQNPGAEPGNLCIFINREQNLTTFFSGKFSGISPTDPEGKEPLGAGPTGSMLRLIPEKAGEGLYAYGDWAVTAP